jgi:hypothetical protein
MKLMKINYFIVCASSKLSDNSSHPLSAYLSKHNNFRKQDFDFEEKHAMAAKVLLF